MSSLSGRMHIGRVNIDFFPGWKKIKQRPISFVLGYLHMILWKIATSIYFYGFLNQSLGLILGNIFFIKIMACMPLNLIHMNNICKHRTIFNITRKSGLASNASTIFIGARCSGHEKSYHILFISYSYFNIISRWKRPGQNYYIFLHLSYQVIFFFL